MLNYYVRKITLKSGELRYRAILTKSGKDFKSKTFRRKQDATTWAIRTVNASQEEEAKGIIPCTVTFNRLVSEYISAWTGKDHDRARLVSWWQNCFKDILLSEITPDLIRSALQVKRSRAPATYNRHLAVLSSILDFALVQQADSPSKEYIDQNPCKEVRSLSVDNKIVRYLSDEEKPRLQKIVQNFPGSWGKDR